MHYPQFSVVVAIAAAVILIPLPVHLRLPNVALLVLITFTFLMNAFYFVNTIVWAGNVRDVAPVWCDFYTTFACYYPLAAESAALCVCKHLEWVSSPRSKTSNRPNRFLIEIGLCCVFPLISIPIRYAVSSHRYMILEDFGCSLSLYPSKLSVALFFGPQLIVSSVALILACMAFRNIVLLRTSLSAHLHHSQSTITKSRFIRLLILCFIMGLWPILAVGLITHHSVSGLLPWPGWNAVHSSFRFIPQLPTALQPPGLLGQQLTEFWIHPITAYLCFILLTTGEDVRGDFRNAWTFLTRRLLWWRRAPIGEASAPSTTFGFSAGGSSRRLTSTSAADVPDLERVIIITHHQSDTVES